jgi:hypothetical protein
VSRPMSRWRRAVTAASVAAIGVAGALGAAGASAGAATGSDQAAPRSTQQFTLFDAVGMTHSFNRYLQPRHGGPANWTAPVNYTTGRVLVRFQVTAKPSTKPLTMQICAWRNSYKEETCSGRLTFDRVGTYWIDLGAAGSWWKKNRVWSWATPYHPMRLMIGDPVTGKLLMSRSCGAHCLPEAAVLPHVPIRVDASAIVVAKGATLVAPPSWAGCPRSFGGNCTG